MSADVGRPRSLTKEDVLTTLSQSESPVVTSRDVAERNNCSLQTARERLNELEDDGILKSRVVGARSKVWYNVKDPGEVELERITAFPAQYKVVVANPTSETSEILSRIGTKIGDEKNSILFSLRNPSFGDCTYITEDGLRADLEAALSGYNQLIEELVTRWWRIVGIVFRSVEDSDEVLIGTQDAETTEQVRKNAPAEVTLTELSDTTTKIDEDDVIPMLNAAQEVGKVSDYRDEKLRRYEFLKPIYNGNLEDLPTNVQVIGVDDTPAAHCYERISRRIYVVEDGEVVSQDSIDEGGTLSEWVKFIEDGTDRTWEEIYIY